MATSSSSAEAAQPPTSSRSSSSSSSSSPSSSPGSPPAEASSSAAAQPPSGPAAAQGPASVALLAQPAAATPPPLPPYRPRSNAGQGRALARMSNNPNPSGSSVASGSLAAAQGSPSAVATVANVKRRDLEPMEHAFLDLDEDNNDPSCDEWTFRGGHHADQMLDNLNQLRHSGAFCDVTVSATDGKPFPAHRCVLAAASGYFKAMFTSSLSESTAATVTMKGVSPEALELLLTYAYTAEVAISKANVQNLLAAANLLDMLAVRDACCEYLDQHMDETNCLGIQLFAELHACHRLQAKARRYTLAHFGRVVDGEEFLNVGQAQLIDLISCDHLSVFHEEQVLTAVMRWLEANREGRETEFHRVLAHVRLPLISPYFLHDYVDKCSLLTQSRECSRLVEESRLYHLLPDRRATLNAERTRPRENFGLINSIVCVGGEDDKVVLRSVDAWDPVRDSWKQLACLPFAVSKHGLAASGDGLMYMAGGEYPDGTASKAVWRFDPRLNSWQELSSMRTPRSELGLALLDGCLYAVGGWDGHSRLASVERYDVRANEWTVLDEGVDAAVTSPAVVAMGRSLYVCGGAVLEDGDGVDTVSRFDTAVGAWRDVAAMQIPRSGSAICVLNGSLYVMGGWHASTENTNKVERYDPERDAWSTVCPMHERRYRPGVAVLNGKIYVMGGEEGWDRYHESIERYDPEKNRWETVGHMPSSRSWLSCVSIRIKSDGYSAPVSTVAS